MDVKEFLRGLEAFCELSDEELERLVKLAKLRHVKAGEMVDIQGQPADKFYILVNGRLGVVLDLDFGVTKRSYLVTSIGPGEMFAWSGMVGNPHYTASGKTLADSTVIEFDAKELEKEFAEDPKLGFAVMRGVAKTIASRLRHMQLQLVREYALRESEE
ncbi:MAG: Crp/Fnr family transcriptional regulator [candidate division WOR-3 bacterium]